MERRRREPGLSMSRGRDLRGGDRAARSLLSSIHARWKLNWSIHARARNLARAFTAALRMRHRTHFLPRLLADPSTDVRTGGLDRARRTALRNACHGPQAPLLGVSSDLAPTVVYQAVEHRWRLWWPCEACGGVALPLRGDANAGGSNSTRLAPQLDDQPCPACETRRKRRAAADAEPAVWYDTLLSDWVVRLPCRGLRDGALLPLEIRCYDASWAEVYRAAADLAYGSDALAYVRPSPRAGR
jgi:hypothetical protein